MAEKDSRRKSHKGKKAGLRELLRVPGGERVDLSSYDTRSVPLGPGDRTAGQVATTRMGEHLADLQERLWAASTAGDRRRVLLVLQGMDTSGKGGTIKHVIGFCNPSGCRVRAFQAPTPEERAHPFLWRIKKALPHPGELGIFDRSLPHARLRSRGGTPIEDVLIARVRELVPRDEINRRYDEINQFEKSLADDGVTVIKCFLHISHDEQRRRLLQRLDRPDKHWKFDPSDIDDRALWPAYQEAYGMALELCSTPYAPWYVIPSDRKWYRNWAVGRLLLEHLRELDPQYPKADFDVAQTRRRLLAQ
ncbi:PPK2 family polyphosphate kinase [Streptomyces sp. NPDC058676]|uniref:PPK2 family polyphosphate kinase n=1 Tax=unclassified Streptomyces TaxID=2593676 RepID=UPI00364DDA9C